MNGPKLNGWGKLLIICVPLAIAGLIAWGTLRSDMRHAEAALERKADRTMVEVQYERILSELGEIRRRLERLENRR